jgi:hypothetical protein
MGAYNSYFRSHRLEAFVSLVGADQLNEKYLIILTQQELEPLHNLKVRGCFEADEASGKIQSERNIPLQKLSQGGIKLIYCLINPLRFLSSLSRHRRKHNLPLTTKKRHLSCRKENHLPSLELR